MPVGAGGGFRSGSRGVGGPGLPDGGQPGSGDPPEARNTSVARRWLDVSMDQWEAALLIIATIGSLAAAVGAWLQERRTPSGRLAAVDRKLDLVMDHLGIAAPEEADVVRHVANGRMIEAVRAYRRQTGASLVEAKQAVDRIAAGRSPDR
jgi:hypothetical protein